MISCDPNSLADAAKCMQCIPDGAHPWVQTYLLAVLAGVSLDPNTLLAAAAPFQALNGMQDAVQNYLLCTIANQ